MIFLSNVVYVLNVCVPSKLGVQTMCNVMYWEVGLWEVLGHEGGALTNGINAVIRDLRQFLSSFHHLSIQESVLGKWTLTELG